MKGQIVFSIFLVYLLFLFVFTTSETPENPCTKAGQSVCVNCQQVGKCVGSAPPYTVDNITECDYSNGFSCYGSVEEEPRCSRVNPVAIGCGCNGSSCIVDNNTENVYIPCSSDKKVGKAFYCPPAKIEMQTCVCSATARSTLSTLESSTSESSSTSEKSTTTTELSSTSEISSTTELSTTTTTTELSSTSEISSTTELSTTTTTKLTCPDECPFVQDPNEVDCRKYFQCTDEGNVPSQCPSSLCFSQELCACTAPLECTDGCRFVDDPIDDCKKYYYCYNDQLIPYNCTGSKCFSQSSCGCVEEKSSTMSTLTSMTSTTSTTSTTPTTTKLTCPPGCPFVDDPSEDCKKFFICDNGELVPYECPGTLCYREALCQCDV